MKPSTNDRFKLPQIFQKGLAPSIEIPQGILDQLFAALLLTQLLVFIIGNAVTRNLMVLSHTTWIALACLQLVAVFYMLTRISRSIAWGLLGTYCLMLLLVYSQSHLRGPIGLVVGVASSIYALRFLRLTRKQIPSLLLMALSACLTILGTREAYTSFDMLPRLNAGNVHHDTLFHTSIAAMIKNYGVVSTGLHGLVKTPYYALSHALMAGVSILSNQAVIEIYGTATWLLFAPLLIMAITSVCTALVPERTASVQMTWLLTCIVLLLAPALLERWVVWNSHFVSESYLISLGLLMMALPVLFKQRLTLRDVALILTATALMTHAKATVGLIYAGLWITRVLFVRGIRPWLETTVFGLVSAVVGLIVHSTALSHANQLQFKLFDSLRYSNKGGHVVQFADSLQNGRSIGWSELAKGVYAITQFELFHFLPTWIIAGVIAFRMGTSAIFKAPIAVYSLSAAVAGVIVTGFFAIPAGSAYYISNVAFFVAIPGVIALAEAAIPKKEALRRLSLGALLVVGAISSFHTFRSNVIRVNYDRNKPENPLVQALSTLRTAPATEVAYRYVPKEFTALPVLDCIAQPFFFPAVSERPWVDIIRPKEGCEFVYYGYEEYGLRPDNQNVRIEPELSKSGLKVVDFGQSLDPGR